MTRMCLAVFFALFFLAGQAKASYAEEKVALIVGGLQKMIYLPAVLADRLGYFSAEGLEVELLEDETGTDAENRLLTGAVQGVIGFYDHCITLQAKGKFVLSVVQLARTPGEIELATRASGAMAIGDLRGKKLGVTAIGASTFFLTQYLMKKAGLEQQDYSIVPIGSPGGLAAAIKRGDIDAAMTTDPTATMQIESGAMHMLLDLSSVENANAALDGPYPGASLYMPETWVRRHPEKVQKLANALTRALEYIHGHSAEEILAHLPSDYYGERKTSYRRILEKGRGLFTQDGFMPEAGPENVLRIMAAANKNVKNKVIDLSRTFSSEFVKKAKEKQSLVESPSIDAAE